MGMMLMAKTLRRTTGDLRTIAKVRVWYARTKIRFREVAFTKIYRIARYLTKRISEKIVPRRHRTARFSNSVCRIIS